MMKKTVFVCGIVLLLSLTLVIQSLIPWYVSSRTTISLILK
jgi:hypothetical protein